MRLNFTNFRRKLSIFKKGVRLNFRNVCRKLLIRSEQNKCDFFCNVLSQFSFHPYFALNEKNALFRPETTNYSFVLVCDGMTRARIDANVDWHWTIVDKLFVRLSVSSGALPYEKKRRRTTANIAMCSASWWDPSSSSPCCTCRPCRTSTIKSACVMNDLILQ